MKLTLVPVLSLHNLLRPGGDLRAKSRILAVPVMVSLVRAQIDFEFMRGRLR